MPRHRCRSLLNRNPNKSGEYSATKVMHNEPFPAQGVAQSPGVVGEAPALRVFEQKHWLPFSTPAYRYPFEEQVVRHADIDIELLLFGP